MAGRRWCVSFARAIFRIDVLAGAALGTLSAYVFTDAYDENVQLVPWVTSEDMGVSLTYRW